MEKRVFETRRSRLRSDLRSGAVLWLGHSLQPRSYPANTYPFRQCSHVLYYTGLAEPDIAVLSFMDEDRDVLFASVSSMDDIVWTGPLPTPGERASLAGIRDTAPLATLGQVLSGLRSKGVPIHFLEPFQADATSRLAALLGISVAELAASASLPLKRAVVSHRSRKSPEEVAEIEEALGVTAQMYSAAMAMTRPGLVEREIAGRMQGIALSHGRAQSFLPIVTVRGQILHNETYDGVLQAGQLLVLDSGAESVSGYASDITRVVPVSGRFSPVQRDLYEVVLAMQTRAIETVAPRVANRDVHLAACRVCVEGLRAMGLMKGNPDLAVEAGAHALFFPHGIGHMLGLDVHDMEDLGDIVGYGEGVARSTQFGLGFLRLARPLEPGFVVTIEPGIYFIPALIDMWRQDNLHREFIDYDKVNALRDAGGIRIEDDVLVTPDGHRILGPHIASTVPEVEASTGLQDS